MMSSRSRYPFCPGTALVLAAVVLLAPLSPSSAQAQGAQAALLQHTDKSVPSPAPAASQANAAAQDNAAAQQKGIATRAIEKVKQAAKSASDILNRVPCMAPKGEPRTMGSLPHVANKLISGRPVVIVAFGSSSTQGYGSSAPEFTYPNRLAAQLRRQYPSADISVVNRGVGGEDAPEMMRRLQSVIDLHPDLVIWQVGTNAVLRNLDPDETARMVEDGVTLIQASRAEGPSPDYTQPRGRAERSARLGLSPCERNDHEESWLVLASDYCCTGGVRAGARRPNVSRATKDFLGAGGHPGKWRAEPALQRSGGRLCTPGSRNRGHEVLRSSSDSAREISADQPRQFRGAQDADHDFDRPARIRQGA